MLELTVTPLGNRGEFARSELHKAKLAESYLLRHNAIQDGRLPKGRMSIYNSILSANVSP